MKKIVSILLLTAIFFQYGSFCASGLSFKALPKISAEHAVLIDMTTGSIIYEKSAHDSASMASTTKIMTALLLCELKNLDEEITVTSEMVTVEGSSMGLRAGDRVHYRDLLYGMLLASGNDAANSAAISISGSISAFSDLMNARAMKIGMRNSHFVTPSGLDSKEHYSTAYDMALLAREALKNSDFAKACASKSASLSYGNPPYKRTLTNHNKLLKMYGNCVGVKTGFTKKSGRCLVSCAIQDGKGVIAVTLNAPDDWRDHILLLDYGFENIDEFSLKLPKLNSVKIIAGEKSAAKISANKVTVMLTESDYNNLSAVVSVNDALIAPVAIGEIVGSIKWYVNDTEVAHSDITISEKINAEIFEDKDYLYWLRLLLST